MWGSTMKRLPGKSTMLSHACIVALVSLLTLPLPACGAPAAPPHSVWTTLGTMSGPIADPHRSQPANLLRDGDQTILIDAGDGAAEQLAKANVSLDDVQTIIISHVHFDHTGGLFAILGMRYQTLSPGVLTIYGPRGTRELVGGLIAAMRPMTEMSTAAHARGAVDPSDNVKVIEVTDGSKFTIGPVTVRAAVNTHYSFAPGTPEAQKYQSLSFRFDMPDRSIVYTGDTGPSANVEKLAHDASLLVSEIIDPDAAIAALKKVRPNIPFYAVPFIEHHMRYEHLTADEVGLMAQRSGVRALVLTHDAMDADDIAKSKPVIAAHFKGPIAFAHDLENF
jgi:ribonuclease BN (tRNA processing enzyme)